MYIIPILLCGYKFVETALANWTYGYDTFTPILTSQWFPIHLLNIVFLTASLPYAILDYTHTFNKSKIQDKNYISKTVFFKAMCWYIASELCINIPLTIIPIYFGMKSDVQRLPPSLTRVFSEGFFVFICTDFLFYLFHKGLHTEWLYKHVHSVHHSFPTPFSLVAQSIHPVESFILGMATTLPTFLIATHSFTQWLILSMVILHSVDAHSGYRLIDFNRLTGGIVCGSRCHDLHHTIKGVNYCTFTTFWDRVFNSHMVD